MNDVVFAVEKDGVRVTFRSNPVNLFASEKDAADAMAKNKDAEGAQIVPYRLSRTVLAGRSHTYG